MGMEQLRERVDAVRERGDSPRSRDGDRGEARSDPWAGVATGDRPSEGGCDLPSPSDVAASGGDTDGPGPLADD